MRYEKPDKNVVDFAYEIIELHRENIRLKEELKHYKEIHEIQTRTINESIESAKQNTGIVLKALIDPNSIFNKKSKMQPNK